MVILVHMNRNLCEMVSTKCNNTHNGPLDFVKPSSISATAAELPASFYSFVEFFFDAKLKRTKLSEDQNNRSESGTSHVPFDEFVKGSQMNN